LLGDTVLELARGPAGTPTARTVRAVRGVTISTKEVGIDDWTRMLADQLANRANESAAARSALAKMLGQST
jgi:hypothetical protein